MENVRVGRSGGHDGLTKWLMSSQCRRLVREGATNARNRYRAMVAKRTGNLAKSAKVTSKIGGKRKDRWYGYMTADADYAAAHEFGYKRPDGRFIPGHHEMEAALRSLGG